MMLMMMMLAGGCCWFNKHTKNNLVDYVRIIVMNILMFLIYVQLFYGNFGCDVSWKLKQLKNFKQIVWTFWIWNDFLVFKFLKHIKLLLSNNLFTILLFHTQIHKHKQKHFQSVNTKTLSLICMHHKTSSQVQMKKFLVNLESFRK